MGAEEAAKQAALAEEQVAAELIRNEVIVNGSLKRSMLLKNAQIRHEFNERQEAALVIAEKKAQEAADLAAKEAVEAEARAEAEAKAVAEAQAKAEAQAALEAKAAEEAKKLAMTRTVSQQASGKPKATSRSMKLNRKLNSRFAL